MNSIIFFFLLNMGIVRGDLQHQNSIHFTHKKTFKSSKVIKTFDARPKPSLHKFGTGQGSWEER